MKYKLINKQTGEETICDKVVVDGFDYYVSGNDFDVKNLKPNNLAYHRGTKELLIVQNYREDIGSWECSDNTIRDSYKLKKVIATTNPSIDIPKVVDEVEMLAWESTNEKYPDVNDESSSQDELNIWNSNWMGFQEGYNKSQETHPNSDEDMAEFADWCETNYTCNQKKKYWYKYADKTDDIKPYTTKELLQLWKEQQPKTIYYA